MATLSADGWIYKDPDAVLDYTVDWSAWLGTDTIASVTWVVGAGVTEASSSNTSTTATIWLSGGIAGQAYGVTCRAVTAGGRTDDRSFRVVVKER